MTIKTMNTNRIELIAFEINKLLQGTADGHCARVDYLEREEAIALCQYLQELGTQDEITFRVLASRGRAHGNDSMFLTTDEAVEIRNRKRGRLCLFVPSDLVDAAYSSLANSFALIDGRKLHESVLRRLMNHLPEDALAVLRYVRRGQLQASYDQRLDFALVAEELAEAGQLARLGLELWRVGLIADAGSNFVDRLKGNVEHTLELAHPSRISAMARERIQSLKVDKETAKALGLFFRGKAMNDVSAWSRELATDEALTFDKWVFPMQERSNIRSVMVQPFVNARGIVERFCKLEQPDGEYGFPIAYCGPKRTMVVKWACVPPQPDNLGSWSVRILPAEEGAELDEESDFVEPRIPRVPANRRSITIKLDIEEGEIPPGPLKVRVAPQDSAGNDIIDEETGLPLEAFSIEFFMMKVNPDEPLVLPRESRRTVPTIPYGQIEIAMNIRGDALDEPRIQWVEKESYFGLTFPGQGVLTLRLSKMLMELEKRIRDEPRNG